MPFGPARLSPPTAPRGAPGLLFRDMHPQMNRSHCPTGKRIKSWVKTVNSGAEGRTRPSCRAVPKTDGKDTSGVGGEGPPRGVGDPHPIPAGTPPRPHPPAPGVAMPPFYPPNPTIAPRFLSPLSCLTPLRFVVRPSLGPSAPERVPALSPNWVCPHPGLALSRSGCGRYRSREFCFTSLGP